MGKNNSTVLEKITRSYSNHQKIIIAATIGMLLGLTGCDKKTENPAVRSTESRAEQKEIPMSAMPADKKEAPIAVAQDEKVTGVKAISTPEGVVVTAAPTKEKTSAPSKVDPKTGKAVPTNRGASPVDEEEEDNSAMDSISEDDEVVDDSPASPDAPTGKDEPTKASKSTEKSHHSAPTKHK